MAGDAQEGGSLCGTSNLIQGMVRVGRVAAARWTDTAVPLSHRPSQRMCDVQGDGEGMDGSGGVDAEQSHRAKKQESDGMCGESKRWLNINNVGMQVAKCIMQIRGVGMTRGAGRFVHMSMRRHRVGISHLIGRGLNPIFNSAFPGKVFLPCKKMFLLGLFCGGEIVQDSDLLGCYPACPPSDPVLISYRHLDGWREVQGVPLTPAVAWRIPFLSSR